MKGAPKRYPALTAWLAANGKSMKWLSEQTEIPYFSLRDRMINKIKFRIDDIEKILEVTGMTFDELKVGEVKGGRNVKA